MKTYSAKPADIQRQWHVIDASDKILGRLSTQVARLLMGKHKPTFTPSQDTGDFVVVINAEKIRVTGNKAGQKLYYRHSNYPGGFKSVTLGKTLQDNPTRVIEYAVNGMLPRTRLGAQMKKRLRIFIGDKHPHLGQTKASSAQEAK
ncbi:50S ribosomal protein L13 [Chloroflexota bacterium]